MSATIRKHFATPVFGGSIFRGIVRVCFVMATACFLLSQRMPAVPAEEATAIGSPMRIEDNPTLGRAVLRIGDRIAWEYRYGYEVDLPHYILYSPSGQALTVERTEPYPHHRSFWFADAVQLAGHRPANFYNAWYTRVEKSDFGPPFRDRIRHLELTAEPAGPGAMIFRKRLVWEMDQRRPVLTETRIMKVLTLGGGEYFLDLTFRLTAEYGHVDFLSDATHYAWPFLRMVPAFSVQQGGVITNSEGKINEEGTNMQVAKWVDYSNTVDGCTEGVAVFSHAENEHPHRWLTRNYGTFGPRRVDEKSGKRFALPQGQSIATRVGVLVHRGDVREGRVGERYEKYLSGTLVPLEE